ncbi:MULTISPECIES: hypothetical protein [Rhodobacterales]|uniref:hypothetical protein n=1 Tax=Rhodobacterales TaxID=204455 RepID=UPI0011BD4545|nr:MULTISPECIES: hypothetical protein [Rhodobacterales]MDO6591393.1 hypothetical protein [Yoonia sp. 1_MG-2023]
MREQGKQTWGYKPNERYHSKRSMLMPATRAKRPWFSFVVPAKRLTTQMPMRSKIAAATAQLTLANMKLSKLRPKISPDLLPENSIKSHTPEQISEHSKAINPNIYFSFGSY